MPLAEAQKEEIRTRIEQSKNLPTLPESVARSAIYTKTDPVVDWRDCVDSDRSLNVEVSGTHVGLPSNAAVYREVARLLASPACIREPDRIDTQAEPDIRRAA